MQLLHVAQSCPCILLGLDFTLYWQLFVSCSCTNWFNCGLTTELPEEWCGNGELPCQGLKPSVHWAPSVLAEKTNTPEQLFTPHMSRHLMQGFGKTQAALSLDAH